MLIMENEIRNRAQTSGSGFQTEVMDTPKRKTPTAMQARGTREQARGAGSGELLLIDLLGSVS